MDDEALHLAGVEDPDGDLAGRLISGDGACVSPRIDSLDRDPARPDGRLDADARADGDHVLEPAEADGDGARDAVRVLVVDKGVGALGFPGDVEQRPGVVRRAEAKRVHRGQVLARQLAESAAGLRRRRVRHQDDEVRAAAPARRRR